MPSALDLLNRGAALLATAFGLTPFHWQGRQMEGDLAALDLAYDLSDNGKEYRVTSTLLVSRQQFANPATDLPKKGQLIKAEGQTYEIAHVLTDAFGHTLHLAADQRRPSA